MEVNQRALINKILARYSGEFTVFRELLQNSDDAEAKIVEIRFETENVGDQTSKESDLPNLKTTNVCIYHYISSLFTPMAGTPMDIQERW